jgi:hypothetical protein
MILETVLPAVKLYVLSAMTSLGPAELPCPAPVEFDECYGTPRFPP